MAEIPLAPIGSGSAEYYIAPARRVTVTPPRGELHLTPVWLTSGCTIDRIGVEVVSAGAAGAVARMGMYADSGGGFPSTLIVDGGTVTTTVSGVVEQVTVSVAIAADGLYWLAVVCQVASGTPQLRGCDMIGVLPHRCDVTVPLAAVASQAGYGYSGITGALPATLTQPPTSIAAATSAFVQPFVRAA